MLQRRQPLRGGARRQEELPQRAVISTRFVRSLPRLKERIDLPTLQTERAEITRMLTALGTLFLCLPPP